MIATLGRANFRALNPGGGFGYCRSWAVTRTRDRTRAEGSRPCWKDEEAFQNAKKSAAEGFKKNSFNPPEITKNLKVEIERAVYRRSSCELAL